MYWVLLPFSCLKSSLSNTAASISSKASDRPMVANQKLVLPTLVFIIFLSNWLNMGWSYVSSVEKYIFKLLILQS